MVFGLHLTLCCSTWAGFFLVTSATTVPPLRLPILRIGLTRRETIGGLSRHSSRRRGRRSELLVEIETQNDPGTASFRMDSMPFY
jgi:hypothetical protein